MLEAAAVVPPMADRDALLTLLATPDGCSKRWVWEQYDHLIGGNSVGRPGGDAAWCASATAPRASL